MGARFAPPLVPRPHAARATKKTTMKRTICARKTAVIKRFDPDDSWEVTATEMLWRKQRRRA
jgi:hypothetical protein